jgi:outer membrane biosynthesis protein TonB
MNHLLRTYALVATVTLTAAAQPLLTTPAETYFNRGSATFIRESPEAALAIVNEGLVHHPDDTGLIRLKELIERQQDQQQQQQQQSSSSESSPEEQPPPQGEQEPQEQPPAPDEQEQEPQDQKDTDGEPQESEAPPTEKPRPESAEEMTEEEAEMVLDSLRQLEEAQREQVNQEMIRRSMRNLPPVEKDW